MAALHVWMSHCTMAFTLFRHVPIQELKGSPSVIVIDVLGGTPFPIHVRNVVWGETKRSQKGTLCQVRHTAGEKLACSQQVSGKMHVETCAGGHESPNLRIFQGQEIKRRCAVSAFPPRIPFVTPVLPGPGSENRMMMVWINPGHTLQPVIIDLPNPLNVSRLRTPTFCQGQATKKQVKEATAEPAR